MEYSINGIKYRLNFELPKGGENSAQLILVCLLSGFLSIQANSKYFSQKTNYTTVPCTFQPRKNAIALEKFFLRYDFGFSSTEFITKTLADNREFYNELLAEFFQYFIQTQKSAHTAAFVFLYRILERLSYSVPLLYVSVSKDFIGTFKTLKEFILDDKGGELGFFKLFLSQGKFIDQTIQDAGYSFEFASSQGYARNYFDVVNRVYKGFAVSDATTNRCEFKFKDIPDIIISIRNRFLHTRTGDGKDNISLWKLKDPDEFFQCINNEFCSFLSIVLVHTLARKYQS